MTSKRLPCERLSEQQRVCLRMVYAHMTSKDIARRLDISHHTVDQRVKTAMRILGAGGRVDAARMLVEFEEDRHQPLVYQSPDIEPEPSEPPHPAANTAQGTRGTHAGYSIQDQRAEFAFRPESYAGRSFVVPQPWGGRNDLTTIQRLAVIVGIAIGSALSFGAVTAGLEALSRIV